VRIAVGAPLTKISVAFVDDQPIMLASLVSFFSNKQEFEVVATGASATAAEEIAATGKADVLVMELSIPGSSFDAIARIASASSRTKVVIFTGAMVIDYSVKAIEAGAVGYVIKRSSGRELEEAICAVNRGEMFITPSFAAKVIGALRSPTQQKKAAEASKLNIREEQIVHLLLQGCTNREMSRQLDLSEKTIKFYMTGLMQKLNARNRTEVALAVQRIAPVQGRSAALALAS
jgi:two-component system, NarL family, nitrate/nitrite response regulator NarL